MSMFHIFSDGAGGFIIEPYSPSPGESALGMGMLAVTLVLIGVFVVALFKLIATALLLPLACLLLCAVLFLAFGKVLNPIGLGLLCLPVVMYAFACVCYASMFGATAAGSELMGYLGLIFFGIVMFVLYAGVFSSMESGVFLALPVLIIMFFIWWSTLAKRHTSPEMAANVLKYVFRVLAILGAAGLVVCFIRSSLSKIKASDLLFDAVMLVLGWIPFLFLGNLPFRGILGALLIFAYYGILAGVLVQKKLAPAASLRFLLIPYVLCFAFWLILNADLRFDPPLAAGDAAVNWLSASDFVQKTAAAFGAVAEMIGELISTVVHFVGNLVLKIFDASIEPFRTPAVISGTVGACLLLLLINLILTVKKRLTAPAK